nr:Expressed protein [Ipomoea batatas]
MKILKNCIKTTTLVLYLKRISDVDEEGVLVGGDRHPAAVVQGDLEAGGVVGSENGDDLRVGVLSEPNRVFPELGAGRVVIQTENRVALEENVFDPANIAAGADVLIAVAERVGGTRFELLRQGSGEESEGLGFESGYEVRRDAVVDDLKEPELLAGLDEEVFGVGLGEVYQRHGIGGEKRRRFAGLDDGEFGQDHHGWVLGGIEGNLR